MTQIAGRASSSATPRKFGRVHLTHGEPALRACRRLGPDAWLGEWDETYLAARLRGRTAPIKAFLLDQRHLAGIGNIYADETLWWTQIAPVREAGSLSAAEVGRLSEEIRRRLAEGVRLLGCSLSDFVDTKGEEGRFQNWLKAYGKRGQQCPRCGGTFVRVVVAGRGTTYCPDCQQWSRAASAGRGDRRSWRTKKEPRVDSLCVLQRFLLRSRFAVLRGHLAPRFLCGSLCKLLKRCVWALGTLCIIVSTGAVAVKPQQAKMQAKKPVDAGDVSGKPVRSGRTGRAVG